MAKLRILLGVLTLHVCVSAAPSDVKKPDEIAILEKAYENLESKTVTLLDETDQNTKQGQRRKRWYNSFGFSPVTAPFYPNFGNRHEPFTGYSYVDPFTEIHKRLQEISNVVRQPPPTPPLQYPVIPPDQIPFYLPIFYVPQTGCSCPTPGGTTPPNLGEDTTNTSPENKNNITTPSTNNRFPDLEDERQNFGLVINETDPDDEGEDVGRPISFDPILPDRPMSRPPPPVEHGSTQNEVNAQGSTTTSRPVQDSTTTNPFPNLSTSNPFPDVPNPCDGAILSCCHQLQVTYECFAAQGCPDPNSYGNPCDSNVILRVIDRFQRFYGQRTG